MKSAITFSGVIMSLFLLVFFLIYGGTHLYLFLKVKWAFSPGILLSFLLAIFLLLMVITPMQVRVLEKYDMEAFARFTAYTGYLWMGFIFLFFTASLVIDIYHGLLNGAGFFFHRDFSTLILAKRTALFLPLVLGMAAALYGYF